MRLRGAPLTACLFLLLSVYLQTTNGEDLYWEGEEDSSNEFFEVKATDVGISHHLRRIKRQFFPNFFDFSPVTTSVKPEIQPTADDDDGFDQDLDRDGSGFGGNVMDSKEKTLRVSFNVQEPYKDEYSNRDSIEFREFSQTLAEAVNTLLEPLGSYKASLVRIQSRLDEFSCKVTLDIVENGHDDADKLNEITELLRNHIKQIGKLGAITVNDHDFSTNVIGPDTSLETCADNEILCDSNRCVEKLKLCDGYNDCNDGTDESQCPDVAETTTPYPLPTATPCENLYECTDSNVTICSEQWCDNNIDCPNSEDELNCSKTEYPIRKEDCRPDEFRCDHTRCVRFLKRCDGYNDCYDGTDEMKCQPKQCSSDDFKCQDGRCIASYRQCDDVDDCSNGEDEIDCDCQSDQFKCIEDGTCISSRKRCDNIPHCRNGSDEENCACGLDRWQCDTGYCIMKNKRCDGHVDCPSDRSDERNCVEYEEFKCSSGRIIPKSKRCNREYDCLPDDYSDEQYCPCRNDDFICDNGHCIPIHKKCDRSNDCQDGSDERNCLDGQLCMAYESMCTNGQCVPADAPCNGTVECNDGSDERDCGCKRGEFRCRDKTCITLSKRCDSYRDCANGEDEINCESLCEVNELQCNSANGNVICSTLCDGNPECENGADEDNCDKVCRHQCDDKCLENEKICDGNFDCSDESDELDCNPCDGPDDFRCDNGDCVAATMHCNGVPECTDRSDEENCNSTMIASREHCLEFQFTCKNGECINNQFICDGNDDCSDSSDEENCACRYDEFECTFGNCIPDSKRCDNKRDCDNGADEDNCINIYNIQTTRPPPVYTTRGYDNGDVGIGYPEIPDSEPPRRGDRQPWEIDDTEDNLPYTTPLYERPDIDSEFQPSTRRPSYGGYPETPYQPDYNRPGGGYNTFYPSETESGNNRYPGYYPRGESGSAEDRGRDRVPFDRNRGQSGTSLVTVNNNGCRRNQWRCETGSCIDAHRRCNGHIDCPDTSDEYNCPKDTPPALDLKTYPNEQTIRYAKYRHGGDVVFSCRDEGPQRVAVRWIREGGRPLKPGSTDRNGRLEMNNVTTADSGVYICQAVNFLSYPGAELRVTLTVDRAGVIQRPVYPGCRPSDATCGSGECISKNLVCDGKRDCSDGSDEDSCIHDGICEPNQYQCANRRCVLKTWRCDAEDDCGDGSDEQDCEATDPSLPCQPSEYTCSSNQCIPKSYHCDGVFDCQDKSDEKLCAPVVIVKPPTPGLVRLFVGDTLELVCSAVGVPVAVISWRLNWGHVPNQCISESVNGVGVLKCPNMQAEHSGAYSCEAINNKGATFAVPDAIVFVEKNSVCPKGYFNRDANSSSDCIPCFCFGKTDQCDSAQLYIYNMASMLGEGGTRLVGVTYGPNEELVIDPPDRQAITNKYDYQPLRNGATVTRLEIYGLDPERHLPRMYPYLTLPASYNDNQLTSYGGHISFQLASHSYGIGSDTAMPDIIIKGKYGTLLYYQNGQKSVIQAQFVPGVWQKTTNRGREPAYREDIMLALDQVEMILLRADIDNAGVNITNFVMESAQFINAGLGNANLVEECKCPPGYDGLSCQNCAAGYESNQLVGPLLSSCEPERKVCPEGTYGDPANGFACTPCPCPSTSPSNQFATSCYIGSSGRVICNCFKGYEGENCDRCASGYEGNPHIPGDYCKIVIKTNCNPVGTRQVRLLDECDCKDNVEGRYCDRCKAESFYLSADFRHGCASCFCSGVTQTCTSTNFRRKTTHVVFNTPDVVRQLNTYSSTASGSSTRYSVPVVADLLVTAGRYGAVSVAEAGSQPTVYYWSLPISFAGDKVTSYGGYLQYTLRNVPPIDGGSLSDKAADVQLISDNRLTFHYFAEAKPTNDGTLEVRVQFFENKWQRTDSKEVPREQFLLALADVKTILIKATYNDERELAVITSASIETAEPGGTGPVAVHVEECRCPEGYIGTSCEDCAPGYKRYSRGIYLELCNRCDCNGHSTMCDPDTGVCHNCQDNTEGDNCERCRFGYERDSWDKCVAIETPPSCACDNRGILNPCDEYGNCQCKRNVEGIACDQCRRGTFGLDITNVDGCLTCYCSGVTTECHEATNYRRIPLPAPIIGDNFGDYVITNINGDREFNTNFVPMPRNSELRYNFEYPPTETLYWSLPVFPGNRILSYGGVLQFEQKFEDQYRESSGSADKIVVLIGKDIALYWNSPSPIITGQRTEVVLQEEDWYILNTATPARRFDFMKVLQSLRRVLVKATLTENIVSSTIADVAMDVSEATIDPAYQLAKSVEVCICPEGYTGTSCESCLPGYYKDHRDRCSVCNCNGHNCELKFNNEVVCYCQPPYTGVDCSTFVQQSETQTKPPTRPPPSSSTLVVTITSPTIWIKDVGSTVNFTCQAHSRITRNRFPITWTKAGGSLPYGRSFVDPDSGVLLIRDLQYSDSGKYICETRDGISTAQAIASLTVGVNERTVPVVTIVSAVQDYIEGETIELECRASGNPAPTLNWRRANTQPLPQNAQVQDGLLIIEQSRRIDSGEYRCTATNTEGSDDRIAVVNVRPVPHRPAQETLIVSNQSPTIDEGQSTQITCTGTPSVRPETIQWIRQDGTDFYPNVVSSNGVLQVNEAVLENQGVYICQSSDRNVIPGTSVLTVVPLYSPPPSETVNITTSLDRLIIPTGDSSSVECFPHGDPLPLIRWKKYQGEFGPGTSQRGNILFITNAQESDKDFYVCEAIVDNEVVASIYVYVEIEKREPPKVSIWPQDSNLVTIGTTFQLSCQVLGGLPDPDIVWSREGGQPLSTRTHIRPHNILEFEEVDVNDEGAYTCTASNTAGIDHATAKVMVQSSPSISIKPDNYNMIGRGQSLDVVCRGNGYPLPEVTITDKDSRNVGQNLQSGVVALKIISATDSDDGQYVCRASSTAGTVEDTIVIVIDRGDIGGGEGSGYDPGEDIESGSSPVTVLEGSNTLIRCESDGYADTEWRRGSGRPLQENAHQTGLDLRITNISRNDAGYYECVLLDGDREVGSKYQELVVVAAPRITLRPQSQTARPGDTIVVDCIVDGDDIQETTWVPSKKWSDRVEVRSSQLIFNQIEVEDAGEYYCFTRNSVANVTKTAQVFVSGNPTEYNLVSIEQPNRAYTVGENVQVICRKTSPHVITNWERLGTNQYVPVEKYDGDSMLVIIGVSTTDAGIYRCTGEDRNRQRSFADFNLEVRPDSNTPQRNDNSPYDKHLYEDVDIPCIHTLDPPVSIQWRKEYSSLPSYVADKAPVLSLRNISENDAGIYICRVMNRWTTYEDRSILRVNGLVPQFNGHAWIQLPTLKEAYSKFDIEISFRPYDNDGLLLYNSNQRNGNDDYLALQLIKGTPQFLMETGVGPVVLDGDISLELNQWHTIRLSRNADKVTMYVDDTGPFIRREGKWEVLELSEPLYIGGIPYGVSLPPTLTSNGFIGCVSLLVLNKKSKNLISDKVASNGIKDCDTCTPNLCINNGVCQEATNERGYVCLCTPGYAGLNCNRTGEACRPGICGPGKCSDTADGYTCACPVTYTGRNCDVKQFIEYPAFTGSAYLAIKAPTTSKFFKMSMKIKAAAPVTDGIIMYCAESPRGYGGFTSLAVHNGKLELRYDLGDGSVPVIITADRELPANKWTDVNIARVGPDVSLKVDLIKSYEGRLDSPKKDLTLETAMYVGGVDDSITLNNNTGVTGGFNGCIKEVQVYGNAVDIVNSSIQSANVKECSMYERGDIPEDESVCPDCQNGGSCVPNWGVCQCLPGFSGTYCEIDNRRTTRSACAILPCKNGGTCRPDPSTMMNYTCDCPLGYSGTNCQMILELLQSVGFNGNGYLELPSRLLRYDVAEMAIIALAMHTIKDGVLLYQKQGAYPDDFTSDYILLRVEKGFVVVEWNLGGGVSSLSSKVFVANGERHTVIVKFLPDGIISIDVDYSSKNATSVGLQKMMNADSNIYIGGIPESLNWKHLPGLTGCIEQVELMNTGRGLNLGREAVAARNTQPCRDPEPDY